jgi:DNA-binding beta-propeller fold protein YncE
VSEPWGIAVEDKTLYVASYQDSAIYEFDAAKGRPPTGSIELGGAPTNITVEPVAALGN